MAQVAASDIPSNIEELIQRLKTYKVSDEDLERFGEEMEEEDYDVEAITEDVKHGIQESMLVESFIENYEGKERLYHLLKAILEGTEPVQQSATEEKVQQDANGGDAAGPPPLAAQNDDKPLSNKSSSSKPMTSSNPMATNSPPSGHGPDSGNGNGNVEQEEEMKDADDEGPYIHSLIRHELQSLKAADAKQQPDGTVILDPALLDIPHEAISYAFCLENMKGILYILKYNNAHPSEANGTLILSSFIDFWRNFLRDEHDTTFETMKEEINNNQGALYDNMMENPPNDRLLPILEKLVDQLARPALPRGACKGDDTESDSKADDVKESAVSAPPQWHKDVAAFFDSLPLFPKEDWPSALYRTCQLFQKNADENNYDRYELMVTVFDIFSRLCFDRGMKPTTAHLKRYFNDHHLTRLNDKDWHAVKCTFGELHSGKGGKMQGLFCPLPPPSGSSSSSGSGSDVICGDLFAIQSLSCSFLLFVKSFMCKSGNSLEQHDHFRKSKGKKKGRSSKPEVRKSLREVKRGNKKDGGVEVTDDDVSFWNSNFPLQFDFVVVPRGEKLQHGLAMDKKHRGFDVVSEDLKVAEDGGDSEAVYAVYGAMVRLFRKMLQQKGNMKGGDVLEEQQAEGDKSRRDDRFCVVADRNMKKLFMFPPHIKNGGATAKKIVHRKRMDSAQMAATKKDSGGKPPMEEQDDEEMGGSKDEMVDNVFSFIPQQYNDFSNLYLSQHCLLPTHTDTDTQQLGAMDTVFMLSAHFHRQREWHRHPKLRVYQYLGGRAMRFFHSPKPTMRGYAAKRDMTQVWPRFFGGHSMTEKHIEDLLLFDAVMDLYKCDPNFLRWDCSVMRQWVDVPAQCELAAMSRDREKGIGLLNGNTVRNTVHSKAANTRWTVDKDDKWLWPEEKDKAEEKTEAPKRTVFTLRNGDGYLGVAKRDGTLKMEKSKKKMEQPVRAGLAWTFERFYDEGRRKEGVSVRNVENNCYLADLVQYDGGEGLIMYWDIVPLDK